MRGPFHTFRLRRKWLVAQAMHAQEHEAGIDTSLSCDAVGHMLSIDDYLDYFDRDAERKFLREYREIKL